MSTLQTQILFLDAFGDSRNRECGEGSPHMAALIPILKSASNDRVDGSSGNDA
jgi:hypothetical protein